MVAQPVNVITAKRVAFLVLPMRIDVFLGNLLQAVGALAGHHHAGLERGERGRFTRPSSARASNSDRADTHARRCACCDVEEHGRVDPRHRRRIRGA